MIRQGNIIKRELINVTATLQYIKPGQTVKFKKADINVNSLSATARKMNSQGFKYYVSDRHENEYLIVRREK